MPRRDEDPRNLVALLGELMGLIHRRTAGDLLATMGEVGLTMPQLVSLHILASAGARSVSDLSAKLKLSLPATSQLVDRLVRSGLARRQEDPKDRRQRRVSIAPSGRAVVQRLNKERAKELAVVTGRLSPDLRRQLSVILEDVVGELRLPDEPR
jgi:DNA-binding MarR family transcriptional regulator